MPDTSESRSQSQLSSHRRLAGLVLAGCGLALACSSPPPPPPQARSTTQNDLADAPSWVTRGCDAYFGDGAGGVCGIGVMGGTRNIPLAISTAEGRGRTAIARTLDVEVRAMLKDYQATTTGGEDFGSAANDEQHVVDVSKQITNVQLSGTERRDMWISPRGDVYVLMVLDTASFQRRVYAMQGVDQVERAWLAQNAPAAFGGGEQHVSSAPPAEPGAAGSSRSPGPLVLVTQAELDALPQDVPVAWGKKKTSPNGPRIQIDSPTDNSTYQGPFPIKVEFVPGPEGHAVDMESLRLEYKMAWGIDITDKVRDYLDGTTIDVAESELPSGRHTVEIEIQDIEENLSTRVFTVTIQ